MASSQPGSGVGSPVAPPATSDQVWAPPHLPVQQYMFYLFGAFLKGCLFGVLEELTGAVLKLSLIHI